ncbi:MAG: GNAT family N-acetyltransferase [Erysipelotrichaceae bacterium]|nr:GNAT family N-acetyltransferase [Erysipelotrichaceae bacterium]
MQFKTGSGWKACFDKERNYYSAQYGGIMAYHLYEISKEQFDKLDEKMSEYEASDIICKGRHLYMSVDDRCGPPYSIAFDNEYRKLCPWANIMGSGRLWPEELTDAAVEIFESEKNNRKQRREKREKREKQKEDLKMIHLEKIDHKNIWDIMDLKVKRDQREFVASNVISIVDAYATIGTKCHAFPFGIYKDKKPVGFLMIGYNEAVMYDVYDVKPPEALKNNYSIWRLMIDKRYQGRGYGKKAIELALDFIRIWPCGKAEYCEISFEPENTHARDLYSSMGFVENGEMDGEEIVMVMKL